MNLEEKKKIAEMVGKWLGTLTVVFLAPLLLMLGVNKVLYEFNCPTFNYWVYLTITYGIKLVFAGVFNGSRDIGNN